MAEPRSKLRTLLRFQINTVINPFDRLLERTLRGRDVVRREESLYLIAEAGIAERSCSVHHFCARKWASQFGDLVPMPSDKIPSQLRARRIIHDSGYHAQTILRTDGW